MEAVQQRAMTSEGGKAYLVISTILLVGVVLATAFLWTLNVSAQKDVENLNTKINEYSTKVDSLKTNNDIAAYDIMIASKSEIEKNIERSKAQNYLAEMMSISKKYKTAFTGFSYDGEKIISTATFLTKDPKEDAITGVAKLIKDFRVEQQKIFELSPVNGVTGDAIKRTYDIAFKIK